MNTNTSIILAGGLGTRLRSVLANNPKCLAPIGKKSFLELQLENLEICGVDRFILALGYKSDLVINELQNLEDRFDIRVVVEPKALGTGGAILNAMDFFKIDEVLVVNGDTYLNGNIDEIFPILDLGTDPPELVRIATTAVSNMSRYGGVIFLDGLIRGFMEKNQRGPGFVNVGLYRVHKKSFEPFTSGDFFSFESEVLPKLANLGLLRGVKIIGDFIDIGVPDDYRKFCITQEV